jgi:ADP-heptose:LPS heptosyltransferase
LVWHQGALGDVLLAGPAVQAVAAQYPGARLTLVGGTAQLGLLAATLPKAKVLSGHHSLWLELFQDTGKISDTLTNIVSQFDLALVLTSVQRPEFLHRLALAGIPRVVWLPSFPAHQRVAVGALQAEKLHQAGLKKHQKPFQLEVSEADRREARARLQSQGRGQVFRVALAPGSGHAKKNWPLDHYAGMARLLTEQHGAEVWWILGPAEAGWQTRLQEKFPGTVLRLLPGLSLGHLAAVLTHFQLYIGNDSGVSHLAAAVGGPGVVAIFGPSDPVIWAPPGEGTIVVAAAQPCAPCTKGREITCPETVCLKALTPAQVLAAIREPRQNGEKKRIVK